MKKLTEPKVKKGGLNPDCTSDKRPDAPKGSGGAWIKRYATIPEEVGKAVGYLYDSNNKEELGEDMLEVQLNNGTLIDAGWYPEGDPKGLYKISVGRGLTHFYEVRCDNIDRALAHVYELALEFERWP